jgi:hypothetical protein
MTSQPVDERERLARKAVQARALVDPLGAKGFRRPAERIERERRARRLTVAAALAAFAAFFGTIVATAPESPSSPPTATGQQAGSARVALEVPIPGARPGDPETIVRILAPEDPVASEVRTRAS